MSDSRAAMLARIRGALASGPAPVPPAPDLAAPVHPPLPAGVPLAEVFATNFQRIGGEFFRCESLAELGTTLRAWLGEHLPPGPANFYVWEPAMQGLLAAADVAFASGQTDFVERAGVGLTSCAALVARTGSILLGSDTASGRQLSIYPERHVVLARPAQVVPDIADALAWAQGAGALPSMLSLTTGPSRTADIEKTLVLGAHGPRRLTLFLLPDDPRDLA